MGADLGAVVGPLSFWQIADIPFMARVATPERWQLTGHDGQLRLGRSVVRGLAEHDRHFGTYRIEARPARRPLRPLMRMRIGHWSAAATAVGLVSCQRMRPGAAYLRVGRHLLDSLTCAVAAMHQCRSLPTSPHVSHTRIRPDPGPRCRAGRLPDLLAIPACQEVS
jgi:hypothetical protein